MQMIGYFFAKRNLYFPPPLLFKKRSRATVFFDAFHLCPFTDLLISYFIPHRLTTNHPKHSHFCRFHSSPNIFFVHNVSSSKTGLVYILTQELEFLPTRSVANCPAILWNAKLSLSTRIKRSEKRLTHPPPTPLTPPDPPLPKAKMFALGKNLLDSKIALQLSTCLTILSYLCRKKRKENSSCSTCGHSLQDLTHLLDCPSSESFRRAIFGTTSSIFDLWSRPWSVARLLSFREVPPRPHPSKGVR